MRIWIGISVLLALLVGAVYVGYVGWQCHWPAMWLWDSAIFFSLVIGGGLMALMFYSSRHGYDEPPSKPPSGFKWE